MICSAYSETHTADRSLLLFRVDQINGAALGVLKDIDDKNSLVAILGVSASLFDILPAELRDHGEVMVQLRTAQSRR